MLAALIVAVVAVATAIAIALCARGVIKRNPLVGIRIPSFFESDEAWMRGHRVAVVPTAIAAALTVVVTIVGYTLPTLGGAPVAIVNIALLLVGVIVGAILGSRALKRDSTK